MPEGFKSDRFRFLARTTITASEEAPTEGSDEIRIQPTYTSWYGSHPRSMKSSNSRLFLPVPTRDPEAAYLGLPNVFVLPKCVWRVVILIACY
ncbi:DUF3346 domain-containing protein [Vibrio lentus]|nr:DUF3346 domain-containing protein [Vibrio lentus]